MASLETLNIENPGRYQSFLIFEPASIRISDNDVMILGEEVQDVYDDVMDQLHEQKDDIKKQILQNRLGKLGQMLDLLQSYEQVIISKFFDRIWRRYGYVSHLGEVFLDLETFLLFFPEKADQIEEIVANRFDGRGEEDMDESEDEEDGEDEESTEEADPKKEKKKGAK